MHVITGLGLGGAESMLLKLLSSGNGSFNPVVVYLSRGDNTLGPKINKLGISAHCLGLRRTLPNPMAVLALRRFTHQHKPKLIQGWMPHGNLMASLAGAVSQTQVPVFWNIRMSLNDADGLPWLTSRLIQLQARLSRYPVAIIYNSQTSASQHEAIGYNAAKRVFIPNGFDCEMFHPNAEARRQVRAELGIPPDSILIGLVARYHPMKDHHGFLRAVALVAQRHPGAYFLLVGRGVTVEQHLLSRVISDEQLWPRTFLLGERLDVPRLTAALDIACSASFWGEGFSNAVGEAMASGVPCVVTDIGDSAYIVGETGLVVPPRNPEAFAQAIDQLIQAGPTRRRQLGEEARRRIESQFSLPIVVQRYEDLYRKYVGKVA